MSGGKTTHAVQRRSNSTSMETSPHTIRSTSAGEKRAESTAEAPGAATSRPCRRTLNAEAARSSSIRNAAQREA
jgi:hypothetical protein